MKLFPSPLRRGARGEVVFSGYAGMEENASSIPVILLATCGKTNCSLAQKYVIQTLDMLV
jgi:hypothetical protein